MFFFITYCFLALWPFHRISSFHSKLSLKSLLLWLIFVFKWAWFYWKFDFFLWYVYGSGFLYTWKRFFWYFSLNFLFNIMWNLKVLISFYLHFLVFSCIDFLIFLDKRLICIFQFLLIIFFLGIKLSIKRLWHFIGKSFSFDFVLHIPSGQKFIHFFSCLRIMLKIPLTIKDEVFYIKVVTDLSQEVEISLI